MRDAVESDIFTCVAGDAAGCVVDLASVVKVARAFHDDDTAERIERTAAARSILTRAALDAGTRLSASGPLASALVASCTEPRRVSRRRVLVGTRSFKTRRCKPWALLWRVLHPGQAAVARFYSELSVRDDAVLTTACAYEVGAATLSAELVDADVRCVVEACKKLGIPVDEPGPI
ncbi:MAG: hypothetical protein VW104_02190 [Halieaceae bacterium]